NAADEADGAGGTETGGALHDRDASGRHHRALHPREGDGERHRLAEGRGGGRRLGDGRRRARLVDRLAEVGRGARGVTAIAAVDGGEGVGAARQGGGRGGDGGGGRAADERDGAAGAEVGAAVHQRHRAGRQHRSLLGGDGDGEGHLLPEGRGRGAGLRDG